MNDASNSASSDGLWVEVSDKKAVLRSFSSRDKAGKPIMRIREPRVRLEKGSRLLVSSTRTESPKDQGDGIIKATGNVPYYYVLDEAVNGPAAGLFVMASDVQTSQFEAGEPPNNSAPKQPAEITPVVSPVTPPEPEVGLVVEVSAQKAVLHAFKSRDKAGKPIMLIREPRIRLDRGRQLHVSATRAESMKDKGDGIIKATGNIQYYFITDHPSNGEAMGLYVKVANVTLV